MLTEHRFQSPGAEPVDAVVGRSWVRFLLGFVILWAFWLVSASWMPLVAGAW